MTQTSACKTNNCHRMQCRWSERKGGITTEWTPVSLEKYKKYLLKISIDNGFSWTNIRRCMKEDNISVLMSGFECSVKIISFLLQTSVWMDPFFLEINTQKRCYSTIHRPKSMYLTDWYSSGVYMRLIQSRCESACPFMLLLLQMYIRLCPRSCMLGNEFLGYFPFISSSFKLT